MTPRTSIARLADCAPIPHPESWAGREAPRIAYIDDTPVMNAAHAAVKAEADATARAVIKIRARLYALHPSELDAVEIGLSSFTPRQLVDRLRQIERDPTLRRWYGFGGEIPAINLRGAMLYARYLRAKAHQVARRAA
jgi:hypothetical protein